MTHWTQKYVGIPYRDLGRDMTGCDCWGLLRLVYGQELVPFRVEVRRLRDRYPVGRHVGQAEAERVGLDAGVARAAELEEAARNLEAVHVADAPQGPAFRRAAAARYDCAARATRRGFA